MQSIGYLNYRTRSFLADFVLPPSRHVLQATANIDATGDDNIALPELEFKTLQSGENLPYAFLAVPDLSATAIQAGAGTLQAEGVYAFVSSYGVWPLGTWSFATGGAGQVARAALIGPLIYELAITDRNQPFTFRVSTLTFTQAGGVPTATMRMVLHLAVLYAEQAKAQELVCPALSVLGDMAPIR